MGRALSSVRAPIRWAGSKKKLLPTLEKMWIPSDARYIEAFAGSACLFFHLQPTQAFLNDTNRDLISAYKVLAEQPLLLHDAVTQFPVNREIYRWLRDSFLPRDEFEGAVRFFYLNRFCFNGIYRTNKLGHFNVPFAPHKTGGFPSREEWVLIAQSLRRATLRSDDFELFVRSIVEKNDFVYLDPPYAVTNRRIFTQYTASEFGVGDLYRLRALMDYIDRTGAVFVVSYALSRETRILADGWHTARRFAQRNVAGFAEHRRKAVEVLITNDASRLHAIRK